MKQLYPLIAWMGLVLIFCCCQRAAFQPASIQQDYISFGKGGGMTNQVDTYYLLADGHVYQHNSIAQESQHLGRLKKADRKAYFDQAERLEASLFGCKEPGNLYYFLSIHTQDSVKACTWGRQGFSPPEEVFTFYQYVQQLVNSLAP
ncbi:hypothetical protein [Catalinimonas niigatensis]|uniref:hypothetical protein n=1 Tax=Catalinimonas niigatensis TaxID=1397264 RepID=UPI002666FF92|nr:hypothetical protein [Catalinimonas niigatensis]WPP49961.1 hypothetical protein PZB72_25185 [Catalinimonas niigatensis]